ncbi:50S ribosomal protein L19 [Candidatus Kaiserbacteria bacterium RIFCSPLOWO2_01_FULL_53_17]|uniref:50S ribosomal protein L19 n=1 Tax=Candidatus Kaiserbacteria bacterium RIFCSPLOWO2_01_FULL_53_17 TaxID=1798511 RepID=A0A1F6EH34_9BACT|nr:MAG: 50S ribosomal protein L19 [Candidatus Kaiserbacteria bacterium RIFCSPLOWO2_01_FULL_53_17]
MAIGKIIISPVNIEERKALGVRAGDTVRVTTKVVDKGSGKDGKDKTRLQDFEGLVLAVKHGAEAGSTFTVRRTIDGIGVERIFPLYSPLIDEIEIVRRARVRRAKLYHIREKAAKEIRRQMRSELHVKEAPVADAVVPKEGVVAVAAEGAKETQKV